ncbi:MAG: hypothetical protein NTU97_00950 [Candidatus Magasanikbacteria bacterium]|nr:hypothetical protein [Candidatus Magasanikbacteria bacterium]
MFFTIPRTPEEQLELILRLNRQHSLIFSSPDAKLARRRHRAKHPTEIGAFKCMDGRIHIPLATNTPLGIIKPWRNLGGMFDLGWPYFARSVASWVNYAMDRGRQVLMLVTYHYSRGDVHRGCAGFGYDQEASIVGMSRLKKQMEHVFGVHHQVVYPILFGFETDLEAGVLHGENGEVVDLSTLQGVSKDDLMLMLIRLYPDMSLQIRKDLLRLVTGNIEHTAEVAASNRPLTETVHREWIIGVGRGFDWLHEPNTALLVGPFSPNLDEPVAKAAGIIRSNMLAGSIDDKSFVLLASAFYRDSTGIEPLLAREKALFLGDFSAATIRERYPDLADKMQVLSVTVDMQTRALEIVRT